MQIREFTKPAGKIYDGALAVIIINLRWEKYAAVPLCFLLPILELNVPKAREDVLRLQMLPAYRFVEICLAVSVRVAEPNKCKICLLVVLTAKLLE